jgi:ABC-type Fe3+/spermidine/putrescine transport system ATPase subunit
MLEVQGIYKTYENKPLLQGVNFVVHPAETVCLLGSSGSGKSTLLRIIAGLESAERGQILWEGKDLVDLPVHRRNFGLMFQDYALFPHRSVAQNIAFGLKLRGGAHDQVEGRVQEVLEMVNMTGFDRRRVTDLSGGEQQRVALARALAPRPRLLMLDEPLGALDRALRAQLVEELRRILRAEGIPAIYVTHDQEEAYTIADRMVLLHGGQVAQDAAPSQVYREPNSAWVARFLGLGTTLSGNVQVEDPLLVNTALGVYRADGRPGFKPGQGTPVQLLFRPGGVEVEAAESHPTGENYLTGRVTDVIFRGDDYRVEVRAKNLQEFQFVLNAPVPIGSEIVLKIPVESILCLPEE